MWPLVIIVIGIWCILIWAMTEFRNPIDILNEPLDTSPWWPGMPPRPGMKEWKEYKKSGKKNWK